MRLENKKILVLIYIFLFFAFLFPIISFAGSQELNSLDFDVRLREDGSMKVTETWNVYIYDTNTLYKTFPMDNSHGGIKDVTVSRIEENGKKVNYSKSNTYQYHVEEEHFQALINPDGDFEIAWGVNETSSSTRTYQITYTVSDCIKVYNDCAELYWQFVGDEFGISSDYVTGKIYLPTLIEDENEFRVWAHGPLNGTINKAKGFGATFTVNNLYSGTFLEIRLTTPINVFENASKIDENRLDTIIAEETAWAEEANQKRERMERINEIISYVITVIEVIAIVFVVVKIIKHVKTLSSTPKPKPEQEYEYFRDFPNDKASAAEAGYLYYYNYGAISSSDIGKMLSGTLLNLSLKGHISFEQIDKKNLNIYIAKSNEYLVEDEEIVYNFLKKASGKENQTTMKEFEKYCKTNAEKFVELLEEVKNVSGQRLKDKGIVDKDGSKKHNTTILYALLEFIAVSLIIAFGWFNSNIMIPITLGILAFIDVVILFVTASRYPGLSQKGLNEKEKWTALKRYMENFSMLDEREVPDLILWEKYLVYATTFGIADKVIEQLKIKYPELQNEEYMRSNFVYMHMACSSSNFSFIDSINSSIGSATNYSSGSGSGGGFSGGGGGRRTAEAAVEAVNLN